MTILGQHSMLLALRASTSISTKLVKRARMHAFLVFDRVQRYPEALRELESWTRDRQTRYREDILDGIERQRVRFAGLYRGENFGKRLIRIAPNVPA